MIIESIICHINQYTCIDASASLSHFHDVLCISAVAKKIHVKRRYSYGTSGLRWLVDPNYFCYPVTILRHLFVEKL